jgi:hypothetical protein
VHQGQGFTGNSFLVIGDSYGKKEINLNQADIDVILTANGRNADNNVKQPSQIFVSSENIKIDIKHDTKLIYAKDNTELVDHNRPTSH